MLRATARRPTPSVGVPLIFLWWWMLLEQLGASGAQIEPLRASYNGSNRVADTWAAECAPALIAFNPNFCFGFWIHSRTNSPFIEITHRSPVPSRVSARFVPSRSCQIAYRSARFNVRRPGLRPHIVPTEFWRLYSRFSAVQIFTRPKPSDRFQLQDIRTRPDCSATY